jgi:hypothetical protein
VVRLRHGDAPATLRKTQEIPSGHDPAEYETRRLNAKASDGTDVPITVLMKKGTPLDGSAPLLLYGYGSYGIAMEASFSIRNLQPGRPRLDLGHGLPARRLGEGLELVPGRQEGQEEEHLHRLHRLRRAPARAPATARRPTRWPMAARPAGS